MQQAHHLRRERHHLLQLLLVRCQLLQSEGAQPAAAWGQEHGGGVG